ncbi:lipopolysaccharide biosynthesis protein [Sphingomonas bacterium]|uniref:lipopolysaccharide biosynthesis protein n=1 Tax=Sphingomonas bacterium TaxID=1895847 RepID=UPI0015767E20|nr:lipopolysaccharide biosynthesis protein [Sphingomonas bacterium]
MHGVIQPVGMDVRRHETRLTRLRESLYGYRWFLGLVVTPTLLVAAYYYLIASNQYQSETHILVRAAEQQKPQASGLGALLSGGSVDAAGPEGMSVADYLTSHDVVATLRSKLDLVNRYRRPGVDWFSRLWGGDQPTDEALLKYYLAQTKVEVNSGTGITVIQARAFTPQDAYAIATALLDLGDQRVNSLNNAAYKDAIASQERQLRQAQDNLARAQGAISSFRANQADIDPTGTGTAQTALVTQLTGALASARAQMVSVGQTINRSSPQYIALARRTAALQAQVDAQQSKLAGSGGSTIASQVAGYNELLMRQQFAQRQYETIATALDRARQQVIDKHLYLVRVVNPNVPEKSQFPQRGRVTLTVFFSLLVAYGIGWMLVAGVKEHAA